jgi:hypothetical protein
MSRIPTVRIVNEAGSASPRVYAHPSGVELSMVRAVIRIDFKAETRGVPVAVLDIMLPDVDVIAAAEMFTTIDGQRYRLVEDSE